MCSYKKLSVWGLRIRVKVKGHSFFPFVVSLWAPLEVKGYGVGVPLSPNPNWDVLNTWQNLA